MLTHDAVLLASSHPLVHLNAFLNLLATVLLVVGYLLIRQRRERAHQQIMLTAFGVSIVFLVSYITKRLLVGDTAFHGQGVVRPIYFGILISHVVLALSVPFLAGVTIWLGYRGTGRWGGHGRENQARRRHRQLARWTLPIWLYVSVTGVVVYLLLYHLYPSPPA